MSIRITEIKSRTPSPREPRVLKVEGAIHLKDAELLESICRQVSGETGHPVIIELNDVCFVDSESATLICRMKRENVVTIEGLNLFTGKLIQSVDDLNPPVSWPAK